MRLTAMAMAVAMGGLVAACDEDAVGGQDVADGTSQDAAETQLTETLDPIETSPETVDTTDSATPETVDTVETIAPDTLDTVETVETLDTADALPETSIEVTDTTPSETTDAPDPAAIGPYAVTRETVSVAGFAAVLFVPDTASAPAIVLAPGFQLDGNAFEFYGAHLASHGIATLVPTFGDSLFAPLTHSALADAVVTMVTWLADDARFDATRIGAAGHSRGGKLAILATTRSGIIKATFGLDPVDTAGGPGAQPSADNPSVTPELMAAVSVPFAVLGSAYGGTPTSPFAPACAPPEDNYRQYALAAANAPVRYEWVAPGSGHNDFADPLPFLVSLACQAGDDPAATRALAKARMTAFFKRHLEGDLRYTLP